MKKIHLFAGLCVSALTLSACGPLPEYQNEVIVPAPVTKTNWAENPMVAPAPAQAIVELPAPVTNVVAAPAAQTPPFTVGSTVSHTMAPVAAPAYAGHHATHFDSTPMAIHTNVAGSYPHNQYNGVNGVRPFLVNTGSVWQGPSTYMLPVGTGNYAHQHLETVSTGYTSSYPATTISETIVETVSAPKTVTASKSLFIRKGPSFSAEKCEVLPKGRTATLEYCEGMWCKISYKGASGWSSKKYLN